MLEFTRVSKTNKSTPVNPEVSISGDQVSKSRRSFQAFHPLQKGHHSQEQREDGGAMKGILVLCRVVQRPIRVSSNPCYKVMGAAHWPADRETERKVSRGFVASPWDRADQVDVV